MKETKGAVILLHATSHALRAEKLIKKAGISCKLIPVPRQFSSDCGVCLRLKQLDIEEAMNTLKERSIEIDNVHEL